VVLNVAMQLRGWGSGKEGLSAANVTKERRRTQEISESTASEQECRTFTPAPPPLQEITVAAAASRT